MPANYTGVASNIANIRGTACTIADPVDSDAPSASSVATPLDTLADFIAALQKFAVFQGTPGQASNNAQGPIYSSGNGTDDTTDHFTFTYGQQAAGYKQIASFGAASGALERSRILVRYDGEFVITTNAAWQGGTLAGGTWESDDAAIPSGMLLFGASSGSKLIWKVAPATGSAFGDSAFGNAVTLDANNMTIGAILGCTGSTAAGFSAAGGVVSGNIREALTNLLLTGGTWGAATTQGGVTWDTPAIYLDAFGVAHLQGGLLATSSTPATILSTPLAARFRPANYRYYPLELWNPNAGGGGVDGWSGGTSSVLQVAPTGAMDIILRVSTQFVPAPVNGGVYVLDGVSWRV